MTDEAVEAVARAIAAERNKTLHGLRGAGHDWRNHIDEAHAAITVYEANRTDVEELREALEEARKIIGLVEHDWIVPKERLNKALIRISSLEKKGS